MQSFIDIAGTNGNGVIMPQTFIEDKTLPKRKSFLDGYYATFKVNKIPTRWRVRKANIRSTCSPPRSSRPAPPTARRSAPRSRT